MYRLHIDIPINASEEKALKISQEIINFALQGRLIANRKAKIKVQRGAGHPSVCSVLFRVQQLSQKLKKWRRT
jgi:hypothetical protein